MRTAKTALWNVNCWSMTSTTQTIYEMTRTETAMAGLSFDATTMIETTKMETQMDTYTPWLGKYPWACLPYAVTRSTNAITEGKEWRTWQTCLIWWWQKSLWGITANVTATSTAFMLSHGLPNGYIEDDNNAIVTQEKHLNEVTLVQKKSGNERITIIKGSRDRRGVTSCDNEECIF